MVLSALIKGSTYKKISGSDWVIQFDSRYSTLTINGYDMLEYIITSITEHHFRVNNIVDMHVLSPRIFV